LETSSLVNVNKDISLFYLVIRESVAKTLKNKQKHSKKKQSVFCKCVKQIFLTKRNYGRSTFDDQTYSEMCEGVFKGKAIWCCSSYNWSMWAKI